MEYAIYPFEYMRITQRHDEGNHLAHWDPFIDYSDKPWDEATQDGGRGYFVPGNDYKVVEKNGSQSYGYNVRLETCNQVKIPFQDDTVILEVTLTHLNADDWNKLSTGQIIHKGEKIIREGTSGGATGNHLHCTANFGPYYGYLVNANGKSCFVYEKSLTPTEAFYVNDGVHLIDSRGYVFKEVPSQYVGTPVARNTKVDQIEVIANILNARKDPSLSGEKLGYINPGFYDIQDKTDADNYTWYKVQNMWIAYNEEWENLYPKEEPSKEEIEKEYKQRILESANKKLEEYKNNILNDFDKWLDSLIEK